MASWAMRRRVVYGGGFLLIILLLGVVVFYNFFYKLPSCSDGVQNGLETGVDCGGSCQALCKADALTPILLWAKAFNVSGSVWSVAAYVENPNVSSSNAQASYVFKIYDANNTLLDSRTGTTFVSKNKKFVIFEPSFNFPSKAPKRVEFEFTSFSIWQKDTSVEPAFDVQFSSLLSTSTIPHIDGTVTNNSLKKINKLELSTMVLDGKENVVAVSRTFLDNLKPSMAQDFVFTWPKPFDLGVESCDKPLDIAVVLDRSGSMRSEKANPPEPFNTVKLVAENFIHNLLGDDLVSVVSFGTQPNIEYTLSANIEESITAVEALTLSQNTEQTNIGGGLFFALQEFMGKNARENSKKVLVLLTDGVPTEPHITGQADYPKIFAETVAGDVKSAGIELYTVGLGKDVNEGFLKSIATDDAHYFFAPTKETLSKIYTQIGSSLCVKKPNAIRVIYRVVP